MKKQGERFVALRAADRVAAAGLQPPAVYNPLSPPVLDPAGLLITVDYALNNPTTVITPLIIDLTLQRFFVDRVFSSAGGVTGGAVVYNEIQGNDLYAARDVQRVAPGEEFPIITFQRRGVNVAPVEKWGGKYAVTWEARDRNNVTQFINATRQLANTIVRKINQRGVEIIEAYIASGGRTVTGNNWSTVVTGGASQSNHTLWPQHDFAKADLIAEQDEMGMDFSLWILNPQEYSNLVSIYGQDLNALLNGFGISLFVTNRVAAGTAYAVAPGQVGEMRTEQPLMSRTWDDPDGIEQTWIQSSVRPVMFANNKFAILKFTGLAG